MDFKIFTDLIDALGKVADGFKAITSLTKTERAEYRKTFEETFNLMDTTISMVIMRLGDILPKADPDFLREVIYIDNYGEWVEADQKIRLCSNLRAALRETQTLSGKLTGFISTKDWDALLKLMHAILDSENDVAEFISTHFTDLANTAKMAGADPQKISAVRDQVTDFRNTLKAERQKLIAMEVGLYEVV